MEIAKILIIDDSEEYATLLKKKLEDDQNFTPYWNQIIRSWEDEDPDDLFMRKMDILNFQKRKLKVDVVLNGKDGIAQAQNDDYHYLLIDYHMPQLNGQEVFRALKNLNIKATKIILSSNEDGRLVLDMAKDGVEFYVEKGPAEMPALLSIMATGLYFDPSEE